MSSVFVVARHVVPARRRISVARAVVFALAPSRCCLNVTLRYAGTDWNFSQALSTMTLISRAASLVLSWNIGDVVLPTLSLGRQFFRYKDRVFMSSELETLSFAVSQDGLLSRMARSSA